MARQAVKRNGKRWYSVPQKHLYKIQLDSLGVDFSRNAIRLAGTNTHGNWCRISLSVGNALNLHFRKDFLDVILDFGCLHHIRKSQWIEYKNNISRVIKKGGYYFLACFSDNSGYIPRYTPRSRKRNWTLARSYDGMPEKGSASVSKSGLKNSDLPRVYNHFLQTGRLEACSVKNLILSRTTRSILPSREE